MFVLPQASELFQPIANMHLQRISTTVRLTGCWLLWSAWCSASGWVLSASHQLSGWGYTALFPFLVAAVWFWLKSTSPARNVFFNFSKWRRRFSRPLPLIYFNVAVLSLASALLYPPWSFDAVTYRLPRVLYWWAEHHWYWIGTLDHRLDYSSTGFEWQMLPVIEVTRSDRLIFLLNWIPFLLMPGLVFMAFRALGVNARSARRWMWLLPAGYCFALQSSGLQNDGYTVNYLLAAIAFAAFALGSRRTTGLWLALLAASLLTGAKVSNLPLLLPLGVLLLPMLTRIKWLDWKILVVGLLALLVSFLPLALLSWEHTGDWGGDPGDQWGIKAHNFTGAVAANLVLLGMDAVHPPYLPACQHLNALLDGFNHGRFIHWLEASHWQFLGVHFGGMVYEGQAGLGFGLAIYLGFLLVGICWLKTSPRFSAAAPLPWGWRVAPWLAWIAYLVYLGKLGSDHTPRIAAAYYPLLLVTLLRWPRVAVLERKKFSGGLAVFAAATVLPILLLTPARPLVPVPTLARLTHRPAIDKIAGQYRFWDGLRDDLAPLRNQLPPGVARLGYAAGFRDTSYGLWKPFGSRAIVELGLPLGAQTRPPADLEYAVVTGQGLKNRYGMSLPDWLDFARAEIIFEMQRNVSLTSTDPAVYDSWYLVRFRH